MQTIFNRAFWEQVFQFVKTERPAVRKRMQFFAGLAALVFAIATVLIRAVTPLGFTSRDLFSIVFVMMFSYLFIIIFGRVRNLFILKICALLMIAVFTFLLAVNYVLSGIAFPAFLPGYLMILFSSCLIIPWLPLEVLAVSTVIGGIYSIHYYYAYLMRTGVPSVYGGGTEYSMGLIFLLISFLVCSMARGYSTREAVEKFNLNKELQKKNKQMQKELELASKVHARIIPRSVKNELADIAITYVPTSFISGDYAKFHVLGEDRLLFMICDVTGHGVSAALLVNSLNLEFERLVKEVQDPGELLKRLDEVIYVDFADTNMYLTAFCGLLDYGSSRFSYSSYGHVPQYMYRAKGPAIDRLVSQTSLVGLALGDEKIYRAETFFDREDKIFLFTDGVVEARNHKHEEFGPDRLESFIMDNGTLEVGEFNTKLMKEIRSFSDDKLHDDVFMFNIRTK